MGKLHPHAGKGCRQGNDDGREQQVHIAQRQRWQPFGAKAGCHVDNRAGQADDEPYGGRRAHGFADVIAEKAQRWHADRAAANAHHRGNRTSKDPKRGPDGFGKRARLRGFLGFAQDQIQCHRHCDCGKDDQQDIARDQPPQDAADDHTAENGRGPEL